MIENLDVIQLRHYEDQVFKKVKAEFMLVRDLRENREEAAKMMKILPF